MIRMDVRIAPITVTANNRKKRADGQTDTDYFRVSAWDALGENCGKYLNKGKKVAVVGSVSVHVYTTQKGEPGASLEVLASEVEFLSSRQESTDQQSGMAVVNPQNNPFDDVPY